MFSKIDGKVFAGDEGIAVAATSDSPRFRLMARLAASGAAEPIMDWMTAERARGTNLVECLAVLADFQTQVFASVIGAIMEPAGFGPARDLLLSMINRKLVSHATIVRESHRRGEFSQNTEQTEPAPRSV